MSLCYKTSDNKYAGCPPIMADARHFTDYRPNCQLNNVIRANNSIVNSNQYRNFLTNNATKIMDMNRTHTTKKNACGPCMAPYNTGSMLPEQSMQTCNNKSCNVDFVNEAGLGMGRDYGKTPEQPSLRGQKTAPEGVCSNWPSYLPVGQGANCCAPDDSEMNYQGDSKAQGDMPRLTVPSGGVMLSGGAK